MTDLAARGIDIPLLNNVIHYDFPPSYKLFVHRSGRTARAGQSGTAYSLLTIEELPYMVDVSVHVGRRFAATAEEAEGNPLVSTYGAVPQTLLNEYDAL